MIPVLSGSGDTRLSGGDRVVDRRYGGRTRDGVVYDGERSNRSRKAA